MRRFLKRRVGWLILILIWFGGGGVGLLFAQGTASNPVSSATNSALPASAVRRSTAELEQLAAPIALYPDPVIATMLPASAYPLEIVDAARFVKDTNNLANLGEQQWDSNVKAVARIPEVLAQMDNNIAWTSDLGEAFINQPKDLMDAIQMLRSQAQASGALQSTPQQDVSDTNGVIEVQPAEPQTVYVPEYNSDEVFGGYSPDYWDYYPSDWGDFSSDYWDYWGGFWPYPYVSFGVGVVIPGMFFFNNHCDWHQGGVWVSQGNVEQAQGRGSRVEGRGSSEAGRWWKPDPNRLETSGSIASSERARETIAGNIQHPTSNIQHPMNAAASQSRSATVQGRGMAPQSERLTPTSSRESPTVVDQRWSSPQIVREGSPVIYRSDDLAPDSQSTVHGFQSTVHSPQSAVHPPSSDLGATSSPEEHQYSVPRMYQYSAPEREYSVPQAQQYVAPPEREYTPPSTYQYSAPEREYTPAPAYQYSAPSGGHVYGGGGGRMGGSSGGFGGGGHMGGGGGRGR